MSKYTRRGGKFVGHTTLTPLAAEVADIADQCQSVRKIAPGFIVSGLRAPRHGKRVKMTCNGGDILLSVRDNICRQEVRVYGSNLQEALLVIARGCRDRDIAISFRKTPDED